MYLRVKGRWYFLVSILDSYSRYIVYWEMAMSMRGQEIAEIVAQVLKKVPSKKPRIVRDNGPRFVAKEWREVMRYFELEEIPIRVRRAESNGRIERYHRSVRNEAFGDTDVEDFYQAKELLAVGEVLQRGAAAFGSEISHVGGLVPGQSRGTTGQAEEET